MKKELSDEERRRKKVTSLKRKIAAFCGFYRRNVPQIMRKLETAPEETIDKWNAEYMSFVNSMFPEKHDYPPKEFIDAPYATCEDGYWRTPSLISCGGPAQTAVSCRKWLPDGHPKKWILYRSPENSREIHAKYKLDADIDAKIIGEYPTRYEAYKEQVYLNYLANAEMTDRMLSQEIYDNACNYRAFAERAVKELTQEGRCAFNIKREYSVFSKRTPEE